jgi:HK97 family phage prohead protease
MALHPKIKELKRRAGPISYSTVSVNERGMLSANFTSDLDNRIVSGYLLVWGSVNMHKEMFIRGCAAKSIADRGPNSNANYKITFLNQHRQGEPLCVFAELIEDDYGLLFRSAPLDNVPWADHVLTQLRSGTLNQFSAGFDYVWDHTEWDENNNCIVCKQIDLYEGSVVTIASEVNTYAIRSAEEEENLYDEIDTFIKLLPRKNQLQARQYIAQLKSLIDVEPYEHRNTTLDTDEPPKNGIDYEYLINNL